MLPATVVGDDFRVRDSVLIPRISEMQARGDRAGIVRLTAGAIQRLSVVIFPIYVFLLIVAPILVTTLFTKEYAAAIPIFLINLTTLPFHILVLDPIARAHGEIGRQLLFVRMALFFALIVAFYFGAQLHNLEIIITIGVIAVLLDRLICGAVVLRAAGIRFREVLHLDLLGRAALASAVCGIILYLIYGHSRDALLAFGTHIFSQLLLKEGVVNFLAGTLALGVWCAIFGPLYLLVASVAGAVDRKERAVIGSFIARIFFPVGGG